MPEEYLPSHFKGYSNSLVAILVDFGNFLISASIVSAEVELVFACLGILVNIFHIFILTRKSIRTGSVNMFLLSIAVGDLFNMSSILINEILAVAQDYECYWPSSYWLVVFSIAKQCVYDVFRRLIVCLAVLMALVRFLVIKNAMSPAFQKLSDTMFGLICIFVSVVVSSGLSSIYFSHQYIRKGVWGAPRSCLSQLPANVTLTMYLPAVEDKFLYNRGFGVRTFNLIDGVFKLALSIALPILTFLLIVQLQIAKRNRRKLSGKDENTKPDYTTKMITLMTVASVIAEGPIGFFLAGQGLTDQFSGWHNLHSDMAIVWAVFPAVNSSTHCLISFVVSTQYKKAVEDSFAFLLPDKRRKSVVSVAPRSSGVGSVASTSEARARRRSEY